MLAAIALMGQTIAPPTLPPQPFSTEVADVQTLTAERPHPSPSALLPTDLGDQIPSLLAADPLLEPPIAPETADSSPPQDLFERVFGQPQTQRTQSLMVPLMLNDQPRGQVVVVVPGGYNTEVLVSTDAFVAAVAESLRSPIADELRAQGQSDGTLTLRSIREVGLSVTFDSRRLELQVTIPPALRSTATTAVGRSTVPREFDQALRPSAVSGYLNLRGSQAIIWSGDAITPGRQPLQLNFDGAINLEGWVLEGSLTMVEGRDTPWQRGALRLVHDDTATAIRYQVGDLTVPVRGYQASLPLVGFSMARNFSLQPYQVTRPVSRFEFFLERPSTVEVFINGQVVQTLRLEPGPQDVRNLPLNGGINGVQLVITDDLGRVERLDFATGVSGDLLAPGVQQFAYSLGFPQTSRPLGLGFQSYDLSQPTLSLAHRFGATNNLTMGGYLQGNLATQMVGLEGTWATNWGNFGWDAALSLDRDHGLDGAARIYYDWLFAGASNRDHRSLRLSAEYRGADFMTLANRVPNNSTGVDLSVAYSQTIFGHTRLTASGRYQVTRDQPSDAYSLSLRIAQPVGRGMTLNATASYGQTAQGQAEPRMFVGFSSSFASQGQFLNTSTTLGNDGITNRLNWSYSPPVTLGGLSTAFTVTDRDRSLDLSSQTRYRGYRTDLSLDHRITIPQAGPGTTAQTSRFTWGTALVFADGVWGWTRPVDNSFVIVAPQGAAAQSVVQVNPGSRGPQAQADGGGPAVLPLSPYSLTTIRVESPDLPLGGDLGASRYTLFPSYRSGTLLRVGSEATVILRGHLVDPEGQPLGLQHGRIVAVSDPNWPAVELVTNRTGRFVAPGLKPGQYELWLFSHQHPIATVDIPPGTTGIFELEALAGRSALEDIAPKDGSELE